MPLTKYSAHEWDWQGISEIVFKCFNLQLDLPQEMIGRLTPVNFHDTLKEQAHAIFTGRVEEMGDELHRPPYQE